MWFEAAFREAIMRRSPISVGGKAMLAKMLNREIGPKILMTSVGEPGGFVPCKSGKI